MTTTDARLEFALDRYGETYRAEFPQGGDAGDHDNAHREALADALNGDVAAYLDGVVARCADQHSARAVVCRDLVDELRQGT